MNQPDLIGQIVAWFRRLFNPRPGADQPLPSPTGGANTMANPQPVTRKVSLVIYNPTISSAGNRTLIEIMGWNDPDKLIEGLIADLFEVSHGYINYQIVERIVQNKFPVKEDGFQYTGADFLNCWQRGSGFHQPDAVNYYQVLGENDIIPKIQSGAIDEVWTVSFPYAGFYESRMAGPGAFWCNAPPLENTYSSGRRFVIMAFNYERGVGEMLESYGHRAESIMQHVFERLPDSQNLWKRFTRYDQVASGQAEVGTVHFAPNSLKDYEWGSSTTVPSRWRNWLNYPDLSGPPQPSNTKDWGNGNMRAHHRWWFSLMPHYTGRMGKLSHNWWEYIVDPDLAQ